MKVIVFATDVAEGDLLRQAIVYAGVEAEAHTQMEQILADWSENAADLIILTSDTKTAPLKDVRDIREITQTPLMVIIDAVVEAVHCDILQAGADLVLMRPVGPRVLVAYVQVLLRRVDMVPQSVLNTFDLENFSLDSATRSVIVGGGVSANRGLRDALTRLPVPAFVPPLKYCTDNAAMSAGLADVYYREGRFSALDLDAITYSQFRA